MNKIIVLLCLFCCSAAATKAQINLAGLENQEPGKCYFFKLLEADTVNTDSLYLEFVPPTFKTETLRLKDLKEYAILQKGGTITIEVASAATQYIHRNPDKYEASRIGKSDIMICLVEVPARYRTLQSEDTLTLANIKIKKRVTSGSIRLISRAEASQTTNKTLGVARGKWSEMMEYLSGPRCGGNFKITDIQHALIAKGYKIEASGILNAETKAAIISFQKKHNLPEGRLDIETLRLLEMY